VAESYAIAKLSSGTFIPVLHNRGSVYNLPSPTEHPSMSGTHYFSGPYSLQLKILGFNDR